MLATRKGAGREGGSEGSVVQSRAPTNRNPMRHFRSDERAGGREVHIHQGPGL